MLNSTDATEDANQPVPLPQDEEERPSPPTNLSENKGVVKAAAVLAVGNIISRMLGLVREIVKSNLFGASDLLGAYTVAALVPMTLFNLITGGEMVSSSLVPVFSDYASKERRQALWDVVSTFMSLAILVLLSIVALVMLFTPQIAWLAGARNFSDQSLTAVTEQMMRLATPAVLFLSIASILTGVLYALKRFTLPAFTAAVFNGTIVVVALLRPDHIDSLVYGLLLGSFLQIILQLPALRDGRFRLQFNWRHPALRRILVLYTPIVIVLLVNQVAIWISYNLAILTGDNSVTYMTYATTLYQFPLGLVVTALSMATLPTLSQIVTAYHAAKETDASIASARVQEFKQTLAGGLRLVLTLVLPATAGLFALAPAIIALLLEHGEFTPQDTAVTAIVLRIYLAGLPFAAIDQMLVFASYARKDTWRPAIVGIISVIIYTGTAVLLLEPLGLYSLMVADAIKHFSHTMMMLWLLQRHLGGLRGFGICSATLKAGVASVLTGLVAFVVGETAVTLLPFAGFVGKLLVVALAGGLGLITFLGLVKLLAITEVQMLHRTLTTRLRRRKPTD
ncbi:murein biosynthesis integral membrane protein MurJ [Candidatus Leptofilum sp.]|uniref:murein biosynthesis integral membrane protein MurJ n=1 Tax=Candidatus Leptofilum sp. TaxID=3241576 RepID=UPI003B5CD616